MSLFTPRYKRLFQAQFSAGWSQMLALLVFVLAATILASGQTSDPQAVALAQKAATALSGGQATSDIGLVGNASRTDGSTTVAGPVGLRATAAHLSRVDFSASPDVKAEFRDSSAAIPTGSYIDGTGTLHAIALHNCWIDVSWFSPNLSLLTNTSDATLVFRYIGTETHQGTAVEHIQVKRYLTGRSPDVKVLVSKLSTTEIYLNKATALPLAIGFNVHPDTNALSDTPVEVDFSDYRALPSGQMVPFSVVRHQGGVVLNIQLSSALVNSGASPSALTSH